MRPILATIVCAAAFVPRAAAAQTEYYDLDAGRPLLITDASPVAHGAWEAQLAPAASRASAGTTWGLDAALAWGAVPRTQIEIGAPLATVPSAGGANALGLAGLTVGALYALNTETLGLPALALMARAVLPVGPLAPPSALLALGAGATRSWRGARLHLNAAATLGASDSVPLADDRPRWYAGAAVDHAWPLQSLLVAGEIVALQPLAAASAMTWSAGAGARWQWSPRLVLDAGVHRRFTGAEVGWSATIGVTQTFAVRAWIAVPR